MCILVLQVQIKRRQDELQTELENVGEDMDKMALLLDEMEQLNNSATELDMTLLDRNIDKMMPELGFTPEDSDQLVAAYRYIVTLDMYHTLSRAEHAPAGKQCEHCQCVVVCDA